MAWSRFARGANLFLPTGPGCFPGIIEDIAADDQQHSHEGETDVKIRTCRAPFIENQLLDLYPHLDANPCGYRHHKPQFDIHLAILITLYGAHQGFGKLVAHVARHGDGPRHAQAHHPRSQHEGAPGADETAHQATNEAYDEQKPNVKQIQVNKLNGVFGYIMHVVTPLISVVLP